MKNVFFNSFLLLLFSLPLIGQTVSPETKKGAELYAQGKYSDAVAILKKATAANKADADAWNMLGLAYVEINEFKESRKAAETAVKLNPQRAGYRVTAAFSGLMSNKLKDAEREINKAIELNDKIAEAFYLRGVIKSRQADYEKSFADAEQAIILRPNYAPAYILKSDLFVYDMQAQSMKKNQSVDRAAMMGKSVEVLENCEKVCARDRDTSTIKEKLEARRRFFNYFKSKNEPLVSVDQPTSPDPAVTPLRITSKPRPNYTSSARNAGVQGMVVLAVIFGADGKIGGVLVVNPLSNGLTEEVLASIKNLKFEPMMKDGKPVTTVRLVEFNFALY